MYRLVKPILLALDAERSHDIALELLTRAGRSASARKLLRRSLFRRVPRVPTTVMGLQFDNPLGLAAGLDKQATAANALSDMGFGFLELGTVTPLPQSGNPKPRLFRITERDALINRMGFNSVGLDAFLKNLQHIDHRCVLGINLGKNASTPIADAVEDYRAGLEAVYSCADYVAINISSPNTPELRALQDRDHLEPLLSDLKNEQGRLAMEHGRYVPIAIKIAPDMSETDLDAVAAAVRRLDIDAVIATNTTVQRPGLEGSSPAAEPGGLSGPPLRQLSTAVVAGLRSRLPRNVPIIGVGGISDADSAWEKLVAGADLVQIYTALVYQGPAVVRAIVSGLNDKVVALGAMTLTDALRDARTAKAS